MTAGSSGVTFAAIEQVRESLPKAQHDPPCEHGACAARRSLAALQALAEAADGAEEHLARAIQFLPASVDISASVYHLQLAKDALHAAVARVRSGAREEQG